MMLLLVSSMYLTYMLIVFLARTLYEMFARDYQDSINADGSKGACTRSTHGFLEAAETVSATSIIFWSDTFASP